MSNRVLHRLAARLEADLRLRFPEITGRFARDEDGAWVCYVEDALYFGRRGANLDDGRDPTHGQTEQILAEVTTEVAGQPLA